MSYFNKRTSNGVFVPTGKGYAEYTGEKGNGSINSITREFGYHPDQLYSPFIRFEPKQLIISVYFEIFTRNIVFILCDPKLTYITEKDIRKYLGDFSVRKHFSSLQVNQTLTDGVDHSSLSVEFLSRVLNLQDVSRNGVFYADRISTYLYFTDSFLSDFQFNDGFFPWAKHLQEVNKIVYGWLADTAYKYWPDDDFQAKKEINIQCEAWSAIPDAFGNEYLHLHRTPNGGANLHMIRVCHYGYPITLSQFKEINHGRYVVISESNDLNNIILGCGLFVYLFEIDSEELITIEQEEG